MAAGVLAGGKGCTAYPAVKPDIVAAGGVWLDFNATFSDAQVSGKLVSAPAWPAHPELIRKFLELLGTKIEP